MGIYSIPSSYSAVALRSLVAMNHRAGLHMHTCTSMCIYESTYFIDTGGNSSGSHGRKEHVLHLQKKEMTKNA